MTCKYYCTTNSTVVYILKWVIQRIFTEVWFTHFPICPFQIWLIQASYLSWYVYYFWLIYSFYLANSPNFVSPTSVTKMISDSYQKYLPVISEWVGQLMLQWLNPLINSQGKSVNILENGWICWLLIQLLQCRAPYHMEVSFVSIFWLYDTYCVIHFWWNT